MTKSAIKEKEAVVSSFAEFLGAHAVSTTKDDKVGRINISGNPLDIALANKGYFQVETPNGVKLTRDGRFKLGSDASLLTLDGSKVLSSAGIPIKLPSIPQDLKEIKIDKTGKISMFNPQSRKVTTISQLGVVDANGIAVMEPNVKQGYNEYSNVALQEEFIKMMPIMKKF